MRSSRNLPPISIGVPGGWGGGGGWGGWIVAEGVGWLVAEGGGGWLRRGEGVGGNG